MGKKRDVKAIKHDEDAAWRGVCDYYKANPIIGRSDYFPRSDYFADPREPWEIPLTPRAKPRQRKMTVARAMKQAAKAGVAVRSATVKADGGVELQLGQSSQNEKIEANPWDSVQ